MSSAYDTIVIGAGHNGLAAAAQLAKAGQRVLVLEGRDVVGGAADTQEFYPGFKADIGAHRIGRLHPTVTRDLKPLMKRGLEFVDSDPSVFAPTLEGHHLTLWRDPEQTIDSIGQLSKSDAARWNDFSALVAKAAGLLESVYDQAPPRVTSKKIRDSWELLRVAGRLRRFGKREMMEVLRIMPMTAVELLDEWFETDVLKGALGSMGITGMFQGPMAAGTAYMFLHQHVGSNGGPRATRRVRGGMGALSSGLADIVRKRGAEIRTNAWVERILLKEGRAAGAQLVDGTEIEAERVVSNLDPKRTFIDLLDPIALDPNFARAVRNIRFRGAVARVNLALGELPSFACLPGDGPHLRGVICISPSLKYLERAFDHAKYGDFSEEPFLEALIPSLSDPGMAPEGKHAMSILVQYAPYHLREGIWDDAKREALGDKVVETLTQYAPNLESAIIGRQVLTPLDLEAVFGLTEGNIYHGEMTLDQLFFLRPVPGWSRYSTPIPGLFLCGAGTHPGGGVTAAPGCNAARCILAE
jgi:phytoene dehydrogenase-like protein